LHHPVLPPTAFLRFLLGFLPNQNAQTRVSI
jgi:hypothetical protein